MKRIWVLIAFFAVLIVILVVFLARTRRQEASLMVLSGTIEAVEIDLSFKSSGRIEYIKFDEGDMIAQGDTISELSHQEILARIRQAEDQVASARAQLQAARIEKDNIDKNLARVESLVPAGAATEAQRDDLLDKKKAASASIEAAEGAARAAASQVDYLKVLYENEFLISPLNGVVLVRSAEPAEIVNPAQTIMTVTDLGNLEIKVYVPEADLGKVRNGDHVFVSVDSYPDREFKGRISRISEKAEFTPKNIQTRQERVKTVYAVTVSTDDQGGILKPGMPCDVTIPVSN